MAGLITTASIPKALWPGVQGWFGMAYDKHQVEYTELFEKETSDKKYEEQVQVVGMGLAPVKTEGSPTSYDSLLQGYIARYTHVAYSLGFIVSHEEMEDNLYMELGKQRSTALAFSMNQTKETIGANIYNNAFSSSFPGADGVALLSASHPTTSAGNLSNLLATSSTLNEAAIESLVIQIGKLVDDRGLKIAVRPHCLVIPVDLEPDANRILTSVLQSGTANNDINYLRQTGMFPSGIKVNHYLTNTAEWFIRTDVQDGLLYFEREGLKFTQDNDFDTENAKFKAYERYSFGWTDWRGLFGSGN